MTILADLPKLGLVYQHTAAAATKKFIREHRENDFLVLIGRLETVLQRRPLEIPLVIKRLFPQPLHHPVDRCVPVRSELVVAPPPVIQRFKGHISGRRRVVPAATRFQRFERLALILFGRVVTGLWFLGRKPIAHGHSGTRDSSVETTLDSSYSTSRQTMNNTTGELPTQLLVDISVFHTGMRWCRSAFHSY